MAGRQARDGLTEAEFAKRVGISQSAVNQMKKERKGRIALLPDGSIDGEESERRYWRETDLEQSERGRAQAGPPEHRANPMHQLTRAKTIQAVGAAQLTREKLARMRGEVISRAEAQTIVFNLARRERDAWSQWPTRVAARIAAELGSATGGPALDIHTVQVCLERYVQEHLAAMSPVDPNPFPFTGSASERDPLAAPSESDDDTSDDD